MGKRKAGHPLQVVRLLLRWLTVAQAALFDFLGQTVGAIDHAGRDASELEMPGTLGEIHEDIVQHVLDPRYGRSRGRQRS